MGTLYAIGALIVFVIGAIFAAFKKGGSNALAKRDAAIGKANANTQKKFDKIDAGKPDLNAALDRLSKRSAGDGDAASK